MIVACAKCGAKNRVNQTGERRRPVCGRCGTMLDTSAGGATQKGAPLTVSDASFAHDVLETRDIPVLLDCWADWCGPCHMIAPVLNELAAEANGRYIIAKLNVDENPMIASQFNVRSIPTMLIFKNGALVDRMVGVQSKQALAERLR